jgi:hypothetical protein
MMKNFVLAVALLSLALAVGCAKGGNGIVPTVSVNPPSGVNASALYPGQPNVMFTATTTNPANAPVTWSLSGAACTGAGNPCGTINSTTGVYQAPPAPVSATVTATLASDSSVMGTLGVTVIAVSVVVTPISVNVGQNLVQQFTAVTVPDDAPQTFNWTCTPTGSCGTLMCTPSSAACQDVSGAVVYTAPASSGSVTIAATSTITQPNPGVGTSKVAVVTSRLASGTYAFRFSGDSGGSHVAAVGSVTVDSKGGITGVEDVLPIPPGGNPLTITSGSYAPSPNNGDNISNNLGTLTLNSTNGTTNIANTYTAVLTSSGVIRMIESDSLGTGSGVMQKSSVQAFDAGAQTFAFGFTGVDSTAKRVGFVGMLTIDGNVTITSGSLDSNDNGNTTNVCGAEPCSVTGSYSQDGTFLGLWHMTLTTAITQHFDFVIGGGVTQTKTAVNPLTLYAISTDPVDSAHPALSGNMVYQVPMTYNNAAFKGTSVSALTGTNANVSLTVGTTDGTSSGTGGSGTFSGAFDQNNDGTVLSVASFPAASQSPSPYTYVATSSTNGRYIFQMLGNPGANPVVAPIPFVLYASGANRGFLLDQSSAAVITGVMEPQLTPNGFSYAATELPGTYAAATIGNSDSGVTPVVENLLLTSTGNAKYNVAGTQNPGNQTLTGTYTLTGIGAGSGTGKITLTAPAGAIYVIYALDASAITGTTNAVITDFFMMDTTNGTPSELIFAQQ